MNDPQDDITNKPSENTGSPLNVPPSVTPPRTVARSKLWLPLILVATLGIGAASYASLAYFFNWWPYGGLDAEVKYLPDDCTWIRSRRLAQVNKTKLFQVEKESRDTSKVQEADTRYGIKEDDIERLTEAEGDGGKITIVTARRPIKAEEVRERLINYHRELLHAAVSEEAVGSYKLFVMKHPLDVESNSLSFCIPENNILIFGPPDVVRKILQRKKKPEFSARLKKIFSEVDFTRSDVEVIAPARESNEEEKDGFDLGAESRHVEAAYTELNQDTTIFYKIVYICKDAAGAEEVRKKVNELYKQESPKDTATDKERRSNLKVSRSGVTVTVTSHVKEQSLLDDLKKEK